MHLKTALTTMLLALVFASGCGGDSASDDAMADVCGARDNIARHVDELQGLTLTTATTEQVGGALRAIRSDLTTIASSRKQLSDDRRQDVKTATDAFADSLKQTASAVGRTVSVDTASADIDSALEGLRSSFRSAFGTLDCG